AFKEAGASLTIEEVELTLPNPGEVLVKVEACGVCFSDTAAQAHGLAGKFPGVPGHEIIGHVAATGDYVSEWKFGDRIGGGWHGGHDGTCPACRKGHFQMRDNGSINGITKNGGYAENCILNAEAGMGIKPGSTVAIQGLGGLGHLAIQYANRFGFRVVAISRDDQKERFVRDLGAHE
ncbi:alcohol dehydrogenase, partial [Penicillium subrubescens]